MKELCIFFGFPVSTWSFSFWRHSYHGKSVHSGIENIFRIFLLKNFFLPDFSNDLKIITTSPHCTIVFSISFQCNSSIKNYFRIRVSKRIRSQLISLKYSKKWRSCVFFSVFQCRLDHFVFRRHSHHKKSVHSGIENIFRIFLLKNFFLPYFSRPFLYCSMRRSAVSTSLSFFPSYYCHSKAVLLSSKRSFLFSLISNVLTVLTPRASY